MNSNSYDFFLHYSKYDSEKAYEILHLLENNYLHRNLHGYIYDRDFAAIGDKSQLNNALKGIKIIFVLLSKESENDKEFKLVKYAILNNYAGQDGRNTIPVYLEDLPDDVFNNIQGINYNRSDFLSKVGQLFGKS